MSFSVSDPLVLMPYQAGVVGKPDSKKAAVASTDLTSEQKMVKLGEPIPIIFCRRRNGNGGVFVSPKATEGRFENDVEYIVISSGTYYINGTVAWENVQATEYLNVKLRLVLTEGDMPQLNINNLFVGNCKKGTWAQKYNQRAGTWDAGNYINQYFDYTETGFVNYSDFPSGVTDGQSVYYPEVGKVFHFYYINSSQTTLGISVTDFTNYNAPEYCGTSGSYSGLTSLSFEYSFGQADPYDRQIHAFVPEGMIVTRLIDSVSGSSDNYVDLAKYLIEKTSLVPSDLIDTTLLTTAANFCDTNSFLYNGELSQAANLSDWLQETALYFLLRFAFVGGKYAFKPLLPINTDYTIKTTAISFEYTFTEEDLLPDGFEIQYIPITARNDIGMQMLWREQPDNDVSIPRTAEVKFNDSAETVPFEQHDMSEFCTVENHAVKVGAYLLSRRRNITHNVRIIAGPGAHAEILSVGDIVRVRLQRKTKKGDAEFHDYLYEIDRIQKNTTGSVAYEMTHFPIDSQGRSIIALDVAAATGAGVSLYNGRVSTDCDENTASTSVSETGSDPPSSAPDASDVSNPITPTTAVGEGTGGAAPTTPPNNPTDEFGSPFELEVVGSSGPQPRSGDFLSVNSSIGTLCSSAYVIWYGTNIESGETRILSQGVAGTTGASLEITDALANEEVEVYAEGRCLDASSSTGYGPSGAKSRLLSVLNCTEGRGGDSGSGNKTKTFYLGKGFGQFIFAFNELTPNVDLVQITGAVEPQQTQNPGSFLGYVCKTKAEETDITVTVVADSTSSWSYTVSCLVSDGC